MKPRFNPNDFEDVSRKTRQSKKVKKDLRTLHEPEDIPWYLFGPIYVILAPWYLFFAFAVIAAVGVGIKFVYVNYGWLGLALCSLIPVVLSVIYYIITSARDNFND